MERCEICGKPTSSHEIGDSFVCHTCWTEKSEKVDELKERIEKEEETEEKKEKTEEEMKEEIKDSIKKREQEEEEAAKKSGVKETADRILNKLDDVTSNEELYSVFEEYQGEMKDALRKSSKRDLFRYLERKVAEKISDVLFEFAKKDGWSFVLDFIENYGYGNEEVIDRVPVEDVVSRMIILTRAEEDVVNIPVEALEYLAKFYDAPDVEWESSFSLGWGFDHPEFDFKGLIEKMIEKDEGIWASGILERAFYADQKKAAPVLIEFLKRDDISNKDKMTLTQSITYFTDERWGEKETSPRYWDWKEAIGQQTFEWDEEVERSLKEVIEKELADYIEREQSKDLDMLMKSQKGLPAHECDFSEDWSFTDLQM